MWSVLKLSIKIKKMKETGGENASGKDRKRKSCSEKIDDHDKTKVPQSASRRHREKINATLEELGGLLPLPEEARSKLDKLTVLKLSVSFFQTQNYLKTGKRKRVVDDTAVAEITNKLAACDINVSDISLEVLDSFFIVLSDSGDVFFVSENVYRYLGYTQTFLMHQNFLNFVHPDDVAGFEKSLKRAAKARIVELDVSRARDCDELEEQPFPQMCFCSVRCHAGRQSSHVSPFYYRSFKFDGKIKPLLDGKMKQYGFFALCTPVNPANPFTSTPKEILQMYSCKLGLDLSVKKLDNRGQKSLYLIEKDILSRSGYFFCHPDDEELMILCHQQVTIDGESSEVVFRLMNGRKKWQWIRGKIRMLYDKNSQPECLSTDNVLLNDEQGPFFRSCAAESLLEWKSRHAGLLSPATEVEKQSKQSSPDSALPPSTATSDSVNSSGRVLSDSPDESVVLDSKDIEIIEFPSPTVSLEETKAHILPTVDHATVLPPLGHAPAAPAPAPAAAAESCMFGSFPLNSSSVEEKPNIRNGLIVNLKTEPKKGEITHAHSKPNPSAHDRINLIKQFLMGEDDRPPPNSCHVRGPLRIDGGVIRDSPPPWTEYPVDGSSVFTELNYQQGDRSSVFYPDFPPQQNGKQPLLHANGFDHIPDILQGRGNGFQNVESKQADTANFYYPFLQNASNQSNAATLSNLYENKVNHPDVSGVNLHLGLNGFNKTTPNCPPGFLGQNGTGSHSLNQRPAGQNGSYAQPQREGNYQTRPNLPSGNLPDYNFVEHANVTDLPEFADVTGIPGIASDTSLPELADVTGVPGLANVRGMPGHLSVTGIPGHANFSAPSGQNANMWQASAQSNPNPHVPQADEVINVDDLTPTLFTDPHGLHENPAGFHSNGFSMDSIPETRTNVYDHSDMIVNQQMGNDLQAAQKLQLKRADENTGQNYQTTSSNSILKMMLSL